MIEGILCIYIISTLFITIALLARLCLSTDKRDIKIKHIILCILCSFWVGVALLYYFIVSIAKRIGKTRFFRKISSILNKSVFREDEYGKELS